MTPKFTDQYRYARGYVRSDLTDVAKTWAAARKKLEQDKNLPKENVRKLKQVGGART